jgi:hypothetical protein
MLHSYVDVAIPLAMVSRDARGKCILSVLDDPVQLDDWAPG